MVILHGGIVSEGYAPHYAPGLMAKVAARRGMEPQACMISSAEYDIGTWVWVYGVRSGALLHCQVIDVSHPRDVARHRRTRRLIELDYAVTKEICTTTRGSSAECPVIIVRLE
jgi:hypothetical protein